ncbi:MAG: amidohydrolase, partial [Magnetococcales bacterium]|nr:amidohydrolase [Magnetococcales bacterium]
MNALRRRFLRQTLTLLGTGVAGCAPVRLWNPCHDDLPEELANHPLVQRAWEGIDPKRFWDCHVHLAGNGDGGSGIRLSPDMDSLWHPVLYAMRAFYLNAGCVDQTPGRVDASYVA